VNPYPKTKHLFCLKYGEFFCLFQEIGQVFNYTFSVVKTNTELHGIPQRRLREAHQTNIYSSFSPLLVSIGKGHVLLPSGHFTMFFSKILVLIIFAISLD
jgi:uncharacterized membrane protein